LTSYSPPNPPTARRKQMIIEFTKDGFLEVYSKVLRESIYFVRNYRVITPKKLVKYTLKEALIFKGLDDTQIRQLHFGKKIFNGEVLKCQANGEKRIKS